MMPDGKRLLIVGAGITGSSLAFELCQTFGKAIISKQVVVWDKSRGPGGRMSTSRSPTNPECRADLGAQYISSSQETMRKYNRFYDALTKDHLLTEMVAPVEGNNPYQKPGIVDMIAPQGMSSMVKFFLQQSGVKVETEREVKQIDAQFHRECLTLLTTSGHTEDFHTVILTIPVPQILKLKGTFADDSAKQTLAERSIQYSSKYSLVYFFDELTDVGLNFGFRFVDDDDIIRYISVDNIKRGKPDQPAAVVFHSTWQFGRDKVDTDKEEVEKLMMAKVVQMFPDLPQPSARKIHRWRYSQVRSHNDRDSKEKSDVNGCFVLRKEKPIVICAGDGFTESSLDGCLQSATKTVQYFKPALEEMFSPENIQ
ncbi:hypothetical protein RvY_10007 [Ramazzottius varieornatus]|uniref:Amine oxidase domain-containing protein n=1 Tax=Ramazzottius varieornatus TaxID=947166 RepID=A0A1D1VDR5_RAMVA|nr:hypothetical protein RvY_10007 [Ramazzottius varieornatus]